jgi:hypothetical protein
MGEARKASRTASVKRFLNNFTFADPLAKYL